MALRLAVVDDWEADRTLLMDGLRCYLQRRQVAAEIVCYQSGEAFLADFAPGKFTVVFLDIYMEGLDGMAVARRIRKVDQNCLLVFITSSSDHAIEGFEVRAFHYLLKPYSPQRLQAVLDCCFERLGAEDSYLEVKSGRLSLRLLLRGDLIYRH